MGAHYTIEPGLEGRLERVVDDRLITKHVGGKGTFSTPAMVGLMEITTHQSLKGVLPKGMTSVGYEICERHVAPAPPGSTIVVTTKLAEVKGNKLDFEVFCHQVDKLLGSGTHK